MTVLCSNDCVVFRALFVTIFCFAQRSSYYLYAVFVTGFEYAVEMTMGGYGPVCKNYHLCRRRRWVRMRLLVQPKTMQIQEVGGSAGAGWRGGEGRGAQKCNCCCLLFEHWGCKLDVSKHSKGYLSSEGSA